MGTRVEDCRETGETVGGRDKEGSECQDEHASLQVANPRMYPLQREE